MRDIKYTFLKRWKYIFNRQRFFLLVENYSKPIVEKKLLIWHILLYLFFIYHTIAFLPIFHSVTNPQPAVFLGIYIFIFQLSHILLSLSYFCLTSWQTVRVIPVCILHTGTGYHGATLTNIPSLCSNTGHLSVIDVAGYGTTYHRRSYLWGRGGLSPL